MATGITDIDKQHKYLFDTLNKANKQLLTSQDDLLLTQIAKDLLGYAITHFENEEAKMQRYDYATAHPEEAETHIAQHRHFSNKIVTVLELLRVGEEVSRTEVLIFLNEWLQDHVLGIDQKLGRFLVKKIER